MQKKYVQSIVLMLVFFGGFVFYNYFFLQNNSCIDVVVSATHRITGDEKVFGDPCSVPIWYKDVRDYNPESISQNEDKVYTVKEALSAVSLSPNDYTNQQISIRAVHADSVDGIGCTDYMILMDQEDVVRKQQLMDFLTRAEMDKAETEKITRELRSLPYIKTGETLTAVPGLFPTESGIYQGHFYDTALTKKCADGGTRFVIDRKIEEFIQ